MQGELRRGASGKVADKNVEVTIMVCNQDGDIIPVSNATVSYVAVAFVITVGATSRRIGRIGWMM